MPIYQYISSNPELGCPRCRKGFELRRPLDRPQLTHCPLCKNPVTKQITAASTPRITKPMSVSDAKKAGFTILEKRCDGSYEKL